MESIVGKKPNLMTFIETVEEVVPKLFIPLEFPFKEVNTFPTLSQFE